MTEPMPEFTFPEPLAVLDHAFPDHEGITRGPCFNCWNQWGQRWQHNCGGDDD